MRLQALAIALVIVGGVGVFIMSLSTLNSLFETRASYYRSYNFAQVFASLERAPLSLVERVETIPGVARVEARVKAYVNLEIEGFPDPVTGHLISLPPNSPGRLNQVYLREGRLLEPYRDDEVLISEEFAAAHRLQPGDTISATINGRHKDLTIVGRAMSPEYIYQIAPGAMFPDYEHYGVLWMAREPLAAAYDMEGAFNHVALTLAKGENPEAVIDRLDELLKPYGGIGAVARKDQFSHRFLTEELSQLETIATVFPVIFFGVAAFLLNVVTSRIISLQREQIASLKAFGYSNFAVGLHYAKLILLIVALGVAGGIAAGIWMGSNLSRVYANFYSLPFILYVLRPGVVAAAATISAVVAVAGAAFAIRKAARLPPAQAMRPEAPKIYRKTLVERSGLERWLAQPTRMILRHIERRPLKSFLTTLGIAMAGGTMVVGNFQESAIDYMVDVQFGMSHRAELIANFIDPTSEKALYSLRNVPGVERVEGFREVPVKLRFEHRSYRTGLQGIPADATLKRLLDTNLNVVALPPDGVVLTDYLAELLAIEPGEMLTVEVLEGASPTVRVPLAGTVKEYLGVNAYMRQDALNRLLKEGEVISGAWLSADQRFKRDIYAELKDMPRIAGVVEQSAAVESFYDTLAETILFFTFVATLLGAFIAFGIVYNSMRIALSERNRELASLRVLGFRRTEVAYILFGELALLILAALPLGMLVGYGLCAYLASQFDTDLYRVPLVVNRDAYAFSATVVIVSSLLSALMMWRGVANLDMVAVLKTKE